MTPWWVTIITSVVSAALVGLLAMWRAQAVTETKLQGCQQLLGERITSNAELFKQRFEQLESMRSEGMQDFREATKDMRDATHELHALAKDNARMVEDFTKALREVSERIDGMEVTVQENAENSATHRGSIDTLTKIVNSIQQSAVRASAEK